MSLFVSDLMTANPITIHPYEGLHEAFNLMETNRIRHLPVVDNAGQLVGVLSQRDLVRAGLRQDVIPGRGIEMDLSRDRVSEAMTKSPEIVDANDSIRDAATSLLDNKIGCLVVVEGGNDVVGILTESDFVRYVGDVEADEVGEEWEDVRSEVWY